MIKNVKAAIQNTTGQAVFPLNAHHGQNFLLIVWIPNGWTTGKSCTNCLPGK